MARIKGGMNAKKKHNRTLKLAKGYRGAQIQTVQSCKTVCYESSYLFIRWKKTAKTSDETAVDRSYQRSSKNERTCPTAN